MKILALIDSFKGTITSKELGKLVKEELGSCVTTYAIADGGDGFLDSISENIALDKKHIKVKDPLFRSIDSYYLLTSDKKTAYIELAKASGISLLKENELNPLITSTYGFGEMILDALNQDVKKIIIGIGGSATNDGGTGMLEALGVKFNNGTLKDLQNAKLGSIKEIDTKCIKQKLEKVEIIVLSDVTNPLLGENGATYVFSKQKGANEGMLPILENNMKLYASLYPEFINSPGSGAAGGVGYALKTFLNAKIVSGIDYLLDLIDYDVICKKYDLIITGEGKIDFQSLQGKVISSIIKRSQGKKVIMVCGINELESSKQDIYSIVGKKNDYCLGVSKAESMDKPEYYFRKLIQLIKNKIH